MQHTIAMLIPVMVGQAIMHKLKCKVVLIVAIW